MFAQCRLLMQVLCIDAMQFGLILLNNFIYLLFLPQWHPTCVVLDITDLFWS